MKKYILAILVALALLIGLPALASGGDGEVLFYGPGSTPTSESGFIYDTSTQSLWLPNDLHLPGFLYVGTVQAEDVETTNLGSNSGYIGDLTAVTLTVNTINADQINVAGLYVSGSGVIDGNLDVVGYVQAAIGNFVNSAFGVISFISNSYVSLTAGSERLFVRANMILFSRWNGTGTCPTYKSLDGSKTIWTWYDNSGSPQSTMSLGSVPTQCLGTN